MVLPCCKIMTNITNQMKVAIFQVKFSKKKILSIKVRSKNMCSHMQFQKKKKRKEKKKANAVQKLNR